MRKLDKLDTRCGVYEITPEDAEEILSGPGAKNRGLKKARVHRYAAAMRHKKWRMTGEPIILNAKGGLLDGQHRLHAVRDYGKPVEFVVLFGSYAFEAMNQSTARNAGDVLSITGRHGTASPMLVAGAARLVMLHERAYSRGVSPYLRQMAADDMWTAIDNVEIAQWCDKHPRFIEIAGVVDLLRKKERLLLGPSPVVAGWYLIEGVSSEEEARGFMMPLCNGIGLEAEDIRVPFRRSLLNRITQAGTQKPSMVEGLHWMAKVWNLRNSKRSTFVVKSGEAFPFIV